MNKNFVTTDYLIKLSRAIDTALSKSACEINDLKLTTDNLSFHFIWNDVLKYHFSDYTFEEQACIQDIAKAVFISGCEAYKLSLQAEEEFSNKYINEEYEIEQLEFDF